MKFNVKDISKKEIESNSKTTLERFELFKGNGYDRIVGNKFIIEKTKPIEGKVIEIGTGKGHLTSLLAKHTKEVVTADISKEEQRFAVLNAAAQNVLDRINFLTLNAEKIPYKGHFFDLVISAHAFHHFKNPFAVLSEMIRVCGKKLVIADFNPQGFEIVREIHKSEGRKHDEECGDFSIVGEYFKERGFSVRKCDKHCQIVYVAERKK
ncbi:MAG: class I SAM-dependent methyltransferase [Candidatus Saganbacteria bacterium]|nr:class I SAM-dependent methyltransferase [Candidatus Saganbacteria bacterium]